MILVTKWFGTFLCKSGKVVDRRLFPKNIEAIALRMKRMRMREILEEEKELGKNASSVAEKRLGSIAKVVAFDSSFIKPQDYGFESEILRQASMNLARESLREKDPSAYITEQVRALDDLIATCNLMAERLREWYGLYYPELEKVVDDKQYAELIARNPRRESVMEALGSEGIESAGIELEQEDFDGIQTLAGSTVDLFRTRDRIEDSIQRKMKEEAPNISAVAGPIIGARLISLAGGLERLASMPTSTVQLLGAEKAMFRHLKDKSRPPKHGVIFQHSFIHKAPFWQRGKIARAMAGKISMASRADFYGSDDISSELIEALQKRIEDIRKRNPQPPKRSTRKGEKRKKTG